MTELFGEHMQYMRPHETQGVVEVARAVTGTKATVELKSLIGKNPLAYGMLVQPHLVCCLTQSWRAYQSLKPGPGRVQRCFSVIIFTENCDERSTNHIKTSISSGTHLQSAYCCSCSDCCSISSGVHENSGTRLA